MTDPFAGIAASLDEARGAWVRAAAGDSGDEVAGTALAELNETIGQLRRQVDAVHATVAARIDRASRPELGNAGLARRQGHRTVMGMIAATGLHPGDASRLVAVGAAIAPRMTLTGEELPARHPHVAEAVHAGTLGVAAAAVIITLLDKVALHADLEMLADAERTLCEQARGLSLDQLHRVLQRAEAWLDPDGVADRESELRAHQYLKVWTDRHGRVRLDGAFDPETGAPIVAAIDGNVGEQFRARQNNTDAKSADRTRRAATAMATVWADANGVSDGNGGADEPDVTVSRTDTDTDTVANADTVTDAGDDSRGDAEVVDGELNDPVAGDQRGEDRIADVIDDSRSLAQMKADALAQLCRHALGCDSADVPTGGATVVVRIDLDDLESGRGFGLIDGITGPVSVETVRRMAADARIIPCVLDSQGEILDWGRARRLFTTAQKLALVERDGGCAMCGIPPGMTQVHHIRWWDRDSGPTDLDNGILLCVRGHHRIHDDGWEVQVRGRRVRGQIWFIPPIHVDPTRTPRRGGRARYDYIKAA
ncbi:DUF222 domain-containing protein [Microbacterium sp. ASV49]|uniref:DUF222 domain-containing protein n=1 Tax=Microbacterium candidum TaxID=3041922 RepID=A0ABT7N3Q9_9MICO|nr:DUF222 domain-containing protein [Microbacterium sp. ASV49]MDL9981351.1 DUF222 domain-containing protein [Microbacterium sp. ASV49]